MPQTLAEACVAGRGDLLYGGYTWRTLDGAAPQGGRTGAPNAGCQCTKTNDDSWNDASTCPSNYLPLPAGWVLAPNDATSIAVVAAHGWSTYCAVLADGTAWVSANDWSGVSPGDSCFSGTNYLATSGGTYTVTSCGSRVLARCG
eukprot:COSAG04_NODE_2824_length_3532_cov_1.608506_5_plen_145_part_00